MAYRRKSKIFNSFRKRRGPGRPRLENYGLGGGFVLDWSVSTETKKGIIIISLFVLAALSLLGLFDLSGEFGRLIVRTLSLLLGTWKWLFPLLALLFGYFMLRSDKYQVKAVNYFGALLLVLGLTALWHLRFDTTEATTAAAQGLGGGYAGVALSLPLLKFTGFWGALVISFAIFLVGVLLTFETSLHGLMWPVKLVRFIYGRLTAAAHSRRIPAADDSYEEEEAEVDELGETSPAEPEEEIDEDQPQFEKRSVNAAAPEEPAMIAEPKKFGKKIELPLDLLVSRSGKPTSGDIKANQQIIKKTLANFGIAVEMAEVNVGPTVTQYAFRPADGVKLSRIINLNSDLALALAAHPIRIEAPIPGRSLVGVEIPNQLPAKVTMNEMLISREFKGREGNLVAALGKDVSGKPFFANLDKMPHLLIAGATGSGKSVCINSVITSLLYQNSPDELKFIMVDPKRVELPLYNNIPYLLTPVIHDVKKTINALKWAISEMERRFEVLAAAGKRNLAAYNKNADDKLPYIIFIIDELADLMSSAANDVEAGIVRLAQMARAVGIHLVLATQRPSVEVITGLIKANIPARIAFSVASLIDSRTILDTSGAEKLVGRGDMLYIGPETSKPKRIQGVYISDRETKNIIGYIKSQGTADYIAAVVEKPAGFSAGAAGGWSDDGDELLGEAKEVIRESGKASASLLQRRLKVGYARAARILDLLEEQGVIGPADGAKPREVFLDRLAGVGPVEFAAREHGLTGELRPLTAADDQTDDNDDNNDDDNDDDTNDINDETPADSAKPVDEETNKANEESEHSAAESVAAAEAAEEEVIEEEMIEADVITTVPDDLAENIDSDNRPPARRSKERFDEGEWT